MTTEEQPECESTVLQEQPGCQPASAPAHASAPEPEPGAEVGAGPAQAPAPSAAPDACGGTEQAADAPAEPQDAADLPGSSELPVPAQLRNLASLRDRCHRSGDYKAAAQAQQELQRLKDYEGCSQMQALQARQREEAAALEADYAHEYQAFVDGWQARVAAARHKAQQQESALLARQAAELEALKLRHGMQPLRPKFSNELLALRGKVLALARQREFNKAEQVKSRAELLERSELALARQEHEARQVAEAEQLRVQHRRELGALVRRLAGVRNDLLAAQQEELEVFSRKFQAAKLALERSQASRRLLAEQAIRSALGLRRPGSAGPAGGDAGSGSGGGSAGRLSSSSPGGSAQRSSPYTSPKGSPQSTARGGGGAESAGRLRTTVSLAGVVPLKASLAQLSLGSQPGSARGFRAGSPPRGSARSARREGL